MKRTADGRRDLSQHRAKAASNTRFIRSVARTCGCIDCGTHEGRLDFDHRDPTSKRYTLSQSSTRRFGTLVIEMDKCDVRCHPCHRRRHLKGRAKTSAHRAAISQGLREWWQRRKAKR